jgi:hypothetical protein
VAAHRLGAQDHAELVLQAGVNSIMKQKKYICPNCQMSLTSKGRYCPHCAYEFVVEPHQDQTRKIDNKTEIKTIKYGTIDSASIMGAIGAISTHETVDTWGTWAIESIYNVTLALILHSGLRIAPSPTKAGEQKTRIIETSKAYECYDLALCRLTEAVGDIPPNKSASKRMARSAQEQFENWITNNKAKEAKEAFICTRLDPGCENWENWSVENAWIDHSWRLNGLFNENQIKWLALILNIDERDLKALWIKTTDLKVLADWSRDKNQTSTDFKMAKNAFLASAILRGKYHANIAQGMSSLDMLNHPVRHRVFSSPQCGICYEIPQTTDKIIKIIVMGAMQDKNPEMRVYKWTENIRKIREIYHSENDDTLIELLGNYDIESDQATDQAISIAKKLNLELYPQQIANSIDIITHILVKAGILVSGFIHLPWEEIPKEVEFAELLVPELNMILRPGERTAQKVTLSSKNLRKLVKAFPGHIIGKSSQAKALK